MDLYAIAMAVMVLLGKTEHVDVSTPYHKLLASGIAQAVTKYDGPTLTGSKEGDVALEVEYAWDESRFRCLSGDGGRSLGPLQLQRVAKKEACDTEDAPRIWLDRAHDSVALCSASPPEERISPLASGSCGRGRRLTRWRYLRAAKWLEEVMSSEETAER